jgi:hypothetical protein
MCRTAALEKLYGVWGWGTLTTCTLAPIHMSWSRTYGSRHGTDHDHRSTLWHELGSFKSTEPSSHNIDIEKFSDLFSWVVVSDIVLDNTSGSYEGLIISRLVLQVERGLRQFDQTSP